MKHLTPDIYLLPSGVENQPNAMFFFKILITTKTFQQKFIIFLKKCQEKNGKMTNNPSRKKHDFYESCC